MLHRIRVQLVSERENLFRPQAVAHRNSVAKRSSLLYENNLMALVTWFAVLSICALVFLLGSLRYKETITVRGVLEPRGGTRKLLSPVNGVLTQIHVLPGQQVVEGQVLASFSTSQFDLEGRDNTATELEALLAARLLLRQERQIQQRQQQHALAQSQQQLEELGAAILLTEQELDIASKQLELGASALNAMERLLPGGNVSRLEVDQRRMAHLELRRQGQQIEQRRQGLAQQREANRGELERLELTAALRESRTERELLEMNRRIAALEKLNGSTLVAPGPGTVAAVAFASGDTVRSGQPVIYLNPPDYQLQAVLYVPSRAVGTMQPGQSVLLSYDAFDHLSYGRYGAVIREISQASLDPREHLLPITTAGEPLFQVIAYPAQAYVEGPDIYRLQSGFALTADVVATDLSLMGYILKPLFNLRGKIT